MRHLATISIGAAVIAAMLGGPRASGDAGAPVSTGFHPVVAVSPAPAPLLEPARIAAQRSGSRCLRYRAQSSRKHGSRKLIRCIKVLRVLPAVPGVRAPGNGASGTRAGTLPGIVSFGNGAGGGITTFGHGLGANTATGTGPFGNLRGTYGR